MKTYEQFNQELNEVAGAIRAVRGLSRVVRPSFKAVKNTRPVATGVKPITRKKGEVIQDNYQHK